MSSILHDPVQAKSRPAAAVAVRIGARPGSHTSRSTRIYGARGMARLASITGVAADVRSTRDFDATLTEVRVDGLVLFSLEAASDLDLHLVPVTQDASAHRLLVTPVSGDVQFLPARGSDGPEHDAPCHAGRTTMLADADDRLRLRHCAEIVGLLVSDHLVANGLPVHGGVLPDSPLAYAASAFLRTALFHLAQHSDDPAPTAPLAGALTDIVRSLLADAWHAARLEAREQPIQIKVASVIELHHRDPATTVGSIARELHLSRRQVYRYFENTGIAGLLAERRVETAKSLIEQFPTMPMREVALGSGFRDVDRLRTHFKRQLGMSPRRFRDITMSPAQEQRKAG